MTVAAFILEGVTMGSFIRKRLQPVAGWRRFASMAMVLGSVCPAARAEDSAATKADTDSGVLQEIIVTARARSCLILYKTRLLSISFSFYHFLIRCFSCNLLILFLLDD